MYQAMLDQSRKIGTFGHGFTYSGHPVAAAVALKTLEIYERERLVEKAARHGAAVPGAARGAGGASAGGRGARLRPGRRGGAGRGQGDQALVRSEGGRRTARGGVRRGRGAADPRSLAGDVLSLCPPLVITPQEIDELFDRLARALDRTLDWVRREGLLAGLSHK